MKAIVIKGSGSIHIFLLFLFLDTRNATGSYSALEYYYIRMYERAKWTNVIESV